MTQKNVPADTASIAGRIRIRTFDVSLLCVQPCSIGIRLDDHEPGEHAGESLPSEADILRKGPPLFTAVCSGSCNMAPVHARSQTDHRRQHNIHAASHMVSCSDLHSGRLKAVRLCTRFRVFTPAVRIPAFTDDPGGGTNGDRHAPFQPGRWRGVHGGPPGPAPVLQISRPCYPSGNPSRPRSPDSCIIPDLVARRGSS